MAGCLDWDRSGSWPSGPEGQLAYIVGDIHGRLDLLDQLLEQIHRDIDARRPEKALLVFLGDLIDRGPDSARVVERLRDLSPRRGAPGLPARQP